MLVAGLLGGLFTLAALREDDQRATIAVAARDLASGARLGAGDVRFEAVRAERALLDALVPDNGGTVSGSVLDGPVRAGDPILRADLRTRAAPQGRRAMSIPIAPTHAVNGRLDVGDRVDVVAAGDREVAIIVADAEVLDIDDPASGALGSTDDTLGVTLAVDARQSQLLAAAIATDEVFLARVTGASSSVGVPPLALEGGGLAPEDGT